MKLVVVLVAFLFYCSRSGLVIQRMPAAGVNMFFFSSALVFVVFLLLLLFCFVLFGIDGVVFLQTSYVLRSHGIT